MPSDLVCEIRCESLTKARAGELAAASRAGGGMQLVATRHRRDWGLEVPDAHELLADATEHESTTWQMDTGRLAQLAEALEWVLAELEDELTFQVEWEPPEENVDLEVFVSREELVRVVRAGAIGTRTRYRMRAVG